MTTDARSELARIKRFDQLVRYLRDRMGWPIEGDDFEELTYEYTPEELGIDQKSAAKIQEIKRLRPLVPNQPWGIFFLKFEPKRLPVLVLRRILSQLALKKRASANKSERQAWAADDLLFVSNYGEGDERQISFAHFSTPSDGIDLPTLKVLGWDSLDTALHLDAIARELTEHLSWPADEKDTNEWREQWRSAFTLRYREVITTSRALSIRLAELARAIRERIRTALAIETDRGPLKKLMKAFQESLVHDLDDDGFADMYAQTISYGLLSARIADPHKKTVDDFSGHMRTSPFLRELMETFMKTGGRGGKTLGRGIDFDELGVNEVIQLLDDANMEAVIMDFGDRNPQEDPVIHFYELFLKEYDAKKRMQRGVFYTPRPVVSYIVRCVDELLRVRFNLNDGLADTTTWGEMAKIHRDLKVPTGIHLDQDFIRILDPATGTGTFLVEVIDNIHNTLIKKWKSQNHDNKKIDLLWNEYVPKHLLTRLHGYELLMAPYAIAHLKIGLKLFETGYRFGSDERARVYLTNALEQAQNFSGTLEFAIPALAHEAQAVNEVKKNSAFTIVIGNPPYSGVSSNNSEYAKRLVDAYKFIDGEKLNEKKLWLQDDYVKFIRFSQMTIERANLGIVGLISNHGYLDNPTFKGMRQSLMRSFQFRQIIDLHGNTKKKETSPDGSPDSNVFDIQQGVAIGLFIRTTMPDDQTKRADLFGSREIKYHALTAASLDSIHTEEIRPSSPLYLFAKQDQTYRKEFESMPLLSELTEVHSVGVVTARDSLTIAFSPEEIWLRVKRFAKLTERQAREEFELRKDVRDWKISLAQEDLNSKPISKDYLKPILYRPFDTRFTYYTGKNKGFIGQPAVSIMAHMINNKNIGLMTTRKVEVGTFGHAICSRIMTESHSISLKEVNYLFPLWLYPNKSELFSTEKRPNLTPKFLKALAQSLGLPPVGKYGLPDGLTADDIFNYSYAILHSITYRKRYAEFLKTDFPRIPLIGNLNLFTALGRIGKELSLLHLFETPRLDKTICQYVGGKASEVEKLSYSKNTVWMNKEQTVGFKGVPEEVWNFQIGGYQVCEKWLKDRKGRKLLKGDIEHYKKIVVALSETIRLMKEIDVVIGKYGGWPNAFHSTRESKVFPFQPIVQPDAKARYSTCVPLVPLKVAAGDFGNPQHIEEVAFEWAEVETKKRLRPGMFVAQVVGKSMEPAIPDGAYCLFASPVEGSRQGKMVLVQLRDATDPETGQRYTVKRYESTKAKVGDSWRHEKITLKPTNPEFKSIILTDAVEGELQVIAEVVEVLGN